MLDNELLQQVGIQSLTRPDLAATLHARGWRDVALPISVQTANTSQPVIIKGQVRHMKEAQQDLQRLNTYMTLAQTHRIPPLILTLMALQMKKFE